MVVRATWASLATLVKLTIVPLHSNAVAGLSDRELQILTLLGQGLRNKEIAERLGVADKTVATYKARLMEKLDITTTMELLACYRALTANDKSA